MPVPIAYGLGPAAKMDFDAMRLAFSGTPRAGVDANDKGGVTGRAPPHRIIQVTQSPSLATYDIAGALVRAGTGKGKFRKMKADGTQLGSVESAEITFLNYSDDTTVAVGATQIVFRAQDLQGSDRAKPGWFMTPTSLTAGQYGYAQIAPAYPDISTGPLGAVEGLRLFRSNGYVQHDSNPASPVTTIGGGAGTEDGIRVERTGIWTGAFYVSIRIPTSASATPPGSYSDKILKVTGPAGSVNLATGAIDGASVVTHDGCLHELFIRRTFTVYINAVAIAPRTNNDGYIATATVWNKIECDHITFFDATIPFTHYLEDGDYLQIFWDTDEDVGTVSGGSIDCATKLVLHYNNEPLA